MALDEKKVFKLITKLKDAWYASGDSIEGLPNHEDSTKEKFIEVVKTVLNNLNTASSTLEIVSQEIRIVLDVKSGEIKKLHKEAAAPVEGLIRELEDYLETLERMAEYKKTLPQIQKKHKALAEALKEQETRFQEQKERYDELKHGYDEKEGNIKKRFDGENSSLQAEFEGSILPILDGCILKISGKKATSGELYNLSVVEEKEAKLDLEPISAKGFKSILSGKESTEIKSRLDFIRLSVNETWAKYRGLKDETFLDEEGLLEEFSEMPKAHKDLLQIEAGLKKDNASEQELQVQISEINDFLEEKSYLSGKEGVLHLRDSLLELYNSAHLNIKSFLDFCQRNLDEYEFPQRDIEKRELQSRVKELETTLDELYSEKGSLHKTLKKTEKDLKDTDFTLTKTRGELEDLAVSLNESNSLAEGRKEELKELSQRHETLEIESEGLKRTVERLKPLADAKKPLEVEVSTLNKLESEKTLRISALEGDNKGLKSEVLLLKKFGEENVELKSEVKKLKDVLAEKEAGLLQTSEDLTEETAQRQKLKEEQKQLEIEHKALNKLESEKTLRISALEGDNKGLKSEVLLLKKFGEENVELKSEVKKLKDVLAEKEAGLAETTEKLTDESMMRQKFELESKRLNEIEERQSLALKKLGVRAGRLKVDVRRKASIEADLVKALKLNTEKASKIEYLEGKIGELKSKEKLLPKLKKESTHLTAEVRALNEKLTVAETKLREKENDLAEESSRKQKLQLDLDELKNTSVELTYSVKNLNESVTVFENQNIKKESYIKELEVKLADLEIELFKHGESKVNYISTIDGLKGENLKMKTVMEANTKIQKENTRIKAEFESLEDSIKVNEKEINTLTKAFSKEKAEVDITRKELQRLQKRLEVISELPLEDLDNLRALEKKIKKEITKIEKDMALLIKSKSYEGTEGIKTGVKNLYKHFSTYGSSIGNLAINDIEENFSSFSKEESVRNIKTAMQKLDNAFYHLIDLEDGVGVRVDGSMVEGENAKKEHISMAKTSVIDAGRQMDTVFGVVESCNYLLNQTVVSAHKSLKKENTALKTELVKTKKSLEEMIAEVAKKEETLEKVKGKIADMYVTKELGRLKEIRSNR